MFTYHQRSWQHNPVRTTMTCTMSQHMQASLVVVCVIMRGMVWIIIASISQQILVIENTGLGHACLSSRPQLHVTTEWTISVPDRNQPQCTFRTKHYTGSNNRVWNKPISEIDSNWAPKYLSMYKRFLPDMSYAMQLHYSVIMECNSTEYLTHLVNSLGDEQITFRKRTLGHGCFLMKPC